MLKRLRPLAWGLLLVSIAFAADVSGTWTFSVQTEQGGGNPTFTFKQDGEKLTGAYTGLFGKADVAGTVKGDKIEFRFKADVQGQSLEVRYTGTIESPSSMKGQVQFGELGSGTWTATRK